jgi:hypothetical protein
MARKILAWILIVLSGVFLFASLAGIVLIWVYNTPLTNEVTLQLKDIDSQLVQAQTTLTSSETELERALRIVDATQSAMDELMQQTNSTDNFLETIQSTLDDKLLPELKTTRDRIDAARGTLQQLQSVLTGVSGFIPGVDLSLPDRLLADLIRSANSLGAEISSVEALAEQASLFVSDTSFLLGGDLTSTRESLQSFLTAIQDYQIKVTGWREQVGDLLEGTPRWIDQASIGLTIFLLWFAISQFGLLLHGLHIRRGGDPLLVLKRPKIEVHTDGEMEKIEHVEDVK